MHAAEPFPHFVDDYLNYLYEAHPTSASTDGVHLHDDLLEDFRRPAIETHVSALAGFARRLDAIPLDSTIKTPGLQFPYPEYLRNIVNQVYQRWDRDGAREGAFAEVSFMILRDGSVQDIRFVTRSGSFAFDLGAQGAVEAAGNSHAFGPLPDGWEADVLPVSFYFKPASP